VPGLQQRERGRLAAWPGGFCLRGRADL